MGPLSRSLPATTLPVRQHIHYDGSSLDGITLDVPWGIEASKHFADSPEGSYESNQNVSIVFSIPKQPASETIIYFKTRYDLENSYDFAYLEASFDKGKSWSSLWEATGTQPWQKVIANISDIRTSTQSWQLRFRIETDYSVNKDGIAVDDLTIMISSSTEIASKSDSKDMSL